MRDRAQHWRWRLVLGGQTRRSRGIRTGRLHIPLGRHSKTAYGFRVPFPPTIYLFPVLKAFDFYLRSFSLAEGLSNNALPGNRSLLQPMGGGGGTQLSNRGAGPLGNTSSVKQPVSFSPGPSSLTPNPSMPSTSYQVWPLLPTFLPKIICFLFSFGLIFHWLWAFEFFNF